MRKSIIMGLGLALSVAGIAAAQQPADTTYRPRGGDHRGGPGGPGGRFEGRGGPQGLLLKDITLSEAQKTQLKQLRESQHAKMEANRDAMKKQFDEARAARQRGDTAAARAIMQRNRQAMDQAREQEIASIRNILTADQRVQFDKNVAELKSREAQRGERGQHGKRFGKAGGRGGRSANRQS